MLLDETSEALWRTMRQRLFNAATEGSAALQQKVTFTCDNGRTISFGKGTKVFFFQKKGSSFGTKAGRRLIDYCVISDNEKQLTLRDKKNGCIQANPHNAPIPNTSRAYQMLEAHS